MDNLKAMQVFVAVARNQGFAPAADSLGLSTSSVSRHVANLEDSLGVQLLRRSTRQVRLTQAGENALEHCEAIVARLDRMRQEQAADSAVPSGRLRVTLPHFLGTILMDTVFAQFARLHPQVELEILLVDRMVNLIDEGFDLALRVGRQVDSTLMTRKILDLHLGIIASPQYLEEHGEPRDPFDLARFSCIIDTAAPYRDRWPLRDADGCIVSQAVTGNITVSGGAPARDLVIGGAGLAYVPEYLYYDQVSDGRLKTVLDPFVVDFGGIYIVYPDTRYRGASIKQFTNLLEQHARSLKRYREARSASGSRHLHD